MSKRLRRWLKPPIFDDENKSHQAYLLHVVLWGLLLVPLPYLLYTVVAHPEDVPRALTQTIFAEVVNISLHIMLRRGYVRAVAIIQIAMFWLFFTVTAVTGSGVRGQAYLIGYALVITMAGLLISQRTAVLMLFLSLLSGLLMAVAEMQGIWTPRPFSTPLAVWVISLILFPMSAVLQHLSSKNVRRALDHARLSEWQARSLIDESPVGILILGSGPEVVLANTAASQILGYPPGELEGQDPRRLIDQQELVREPLDMARLARGETLQMERPLRRADGQAVYVSSTFRRMPDGRLQYIFYDITDRRKADEALRDRNEKLSRLITIASAIATLQNLDAVFTSIFEEVRAILPTDAFLVGLYNAATDGLAYPFVFDAGQRITFEATKMGGGTLFGKVIHSGVGCVLNRTPEELAQKSQAIASGSGSYVGAPRASASILVAPMIIQSQVIGVLSAQSYDLNAYDETSLAFLSGVALQAAVAIENARLFDALQKELAERQALIQELETKNAELERFTYTVSHDLKSPLITIGGFLGYLERDALDGNVEQVQTDVQHIREATFKMRQLLDELLELSRVGRLMNPPEYVPMAEIVQDALALVRGRLEQKRVTVEVSPDLPVVFGDRARLVEVVQNLVDNAAKYMGEQPAPCIRIGAQPGPIFYVADNGIGIPAAYHTEIFGLFTTLEPSNGGTGIGLALVKRIVEVHNGRIWVESAGEGQGSTFFFTINSQ
jgi:PAS domain S-box-containing protein